MTNDHNRARSASIPLVLTLIVLLLTRCYFESATSGEVGANVPYFAQENPYYCAAAVVQMLAKWSGLNFTQDELFIAMNGTPGFGITVDQLVLGIRNFTTLTDAGVDYAPYSDNTYWARQISSVSNLTPVACTTDSNTHSVVLYSGSWHKTTTSDQSTTYSWDDVRIHDPGRGAALYLTAGSWQSLNCQFQGQYCIQIVSTSAAYAGPKTLADYNPPVNIMGADEYAGEYYRY